MNYKKTMPLLLLALQASPALATVAVTSQKLATSSTIQNQLSPPATQNNVSTTQITNVISGSDARKSAKNTEALPLKSGMRYKQARQLLLWQGWRPNLQNEPPNLNSLTVRKLYGLGYVEIEDCAGTGQGFCRFNLINDNGDQLFVVTTPGGNPNPDPFVSKWWIEKKSVSLREGMPYKEARQLLLGQGWQPNKDGDPANLNSLTVRKLYGLGYVEIEDCAGTGQGFCSFQFINKSGDRFFVVTTPGGSVDIDPFVSKWWIEKKSASFNITEGRYWLGATDQALEVKGKQYRYDSEAGVQQWQPISELKYIKNGVVFDGKNYWCLSTLAPQNGATSCSAKGWAAQENLPFVGMRRFNFLGGSGTGQSITIKADGSTIVQLHGTMNTSVLYKGQFSNPIILNDGRGLLLRGNKVHQISADGQIVKSCNGKETCEAELY